MIRCSGKVYGASKISSGVLRDCIISVNDERPDGKTPMFVSIGGIEHTALLTRDNLHSLISQLECALIKGE